jgi:hypothetical protein
LAGLPGFPLPELMIVLRPGTAAARFAFTEQLTASLEVGVDELRSLAMISVGRAVFFCWIGIATLVLAFSFDPPLALKIGGVCALILCLVLVERYSRTDRTDPRGTELWAMLEPTKRPKRNSAERVLTSVLAETYLRFARWAAGAASAFFAAAILAGVIAP